MKILDPPLTKDALEEEAEGLTEEGGEFTSLDLFSNQELIAISQNLNSSVNYGIDNSCSEPGL